ncbi:cell wall-active antibiotics response protein LiaF [Paenibacillus sp. WLX2291]|uniref:cell wall-active antibiotics response protein LiaF n=1 Tax=Paenibacillus sp. WLX2291 TaxID=3296934 RepID=UPI003983DC40
MNRHMFRKTFWGLTLIGLGLVFLLDRLDIIDWGVRDALVLLWPLFLLEIGLNELLFKCKKDVGGWIMTILGVYFLGRNLDWFDYSIGDLIRLMIPLGFVFFGFRMLTGKGRSDHKRRKHDQEHGNPYADQPSSPYNASPPPPPAPSSLDDLFDEKLGRKQNPSSSESSAYQHEAVGNPAQQGFGEKKGPNLRKDEHSFEDGFHDPLHEERMHHNTQTRQDDLSGWGNVNKQNWHQHKQDFKDHMRRMKQDKQWHAEQWKQQHKQGHHYAGNRCSSRYNQQHGYGGNVENRSNFIGDVHIGKDYFELKPLNISHFIGDTMLDLTKAQIPYGVTKINVSAFIGDVKVFIPSGVEVSFKAQGNSFIGNMDIMNRSMDGMMNQLSGETSDDESTGKRVEIAVSVFIGDIRINRVG